MSNCENGHNTSSGHFIGLRSAACEGKNVMLAGKLQQTFLPVYFPVSVGLEHHVVCNIRATLQHN